METAAKKKRATEANKATAAAKKTAKEAYKAEAEEPREANKAAAAATNAEKAAAKEATAAKYAEGAAAKKKQRAGTADADDFDDSSLEASVRSTNVRIEKLFKENGMMRRTCACCSELFNPRVVGVVKATGTWLERLKRLHWNHTQKNYFVSARTKAYYSAPPTAQELNGLALSPAGVMVTESTIEVNIFTPPKSVRESEDFLLHPSSIIFY